MSLWIWGKKEHGERKLYSVSFSLLLCLLPLIGILVTLLLPLIQKLR